MRLRTFNAANMAEAIAQVRRELGTDAIIVSNHVNADGSAEITAAVETAPQSRGEPVPQKSAPAIASVPSLEETLEQRLKERLRGHRVSEVESVATQAAIPFDATRIAECLDYQRVPAPLRDALVSAATALGVDDATLALARALESRFNFEPIATAPRAPVMLVGLPGSGKTVTMAKLAVSAIMQGLETDLISTDAARAGAAPQGEAYGALLGQKFSLAEDLDALSLLLEENAASGNNLPDRSERPCFIDTTSINPFDRVEWEALMRLSSAARLVADTEPVLVLAATGDASLMSEVAVQFVGLGVRRLIATQVDIARRIGPLLAAADASRLSLAQISVTPYLAKGLSPMHPVILAKLILSSPAPKDVTL